MKSKWLVAAGLVAISGVAFAVYVGTFQGCNSCSFGSVSGPEESNFVREVVNVHVDTWQTPGGEPKSVGLCSTTLCATYRYVSGSGMFQRIGPIRSNPLSGASCSKASNCLPI